MSSRDVPLRRNRDFNLLWSGQIISDLGGRISGIAFPLLVLALTGSPARAGIVGAAGALPLLILMLPAGALADRWNRKRIMILADSARGLAMGSIVAALALDRLSFTQIVIVALVDGVGYVFFSVGERSALRQVVADHQLSAALGQNQAREYSALLAGQPLGGFFFSLARFAPFLFDAVSYIVSVFTLLLIRTRFDQPSHGIQQSRLAADIREGIKWFWRQPFVRTTSLLVTGSDFTLNALYLVVIVLAKQRGASAAVIGAMFIFVGIGGLTGSIAAPQLARRLHTRTVVLATQWSIAALVPLLIVVPGRVTPGVLYGAMFFLHPTWNSTVAAHRMRLAPHEMQGRVSSIATLLSLGPAPLASLTAGFLLQSAGTTPTILVLTGVMLLVAISALASRSVRDAPDDLGKPLDNRRAQDEGPPIPSA